MKITFARGDSYDKGFVLKDTATGQAVTDTFDEIYFTVKKAFTDKTFKLQKLLSDGGIVADGDGHYTIHILPEDTNGMEFGDYDADIEFVRGDYKRTFPIDFSLTKEVTHRGNEHE